VSSALASRFSTTGPPEKSTSLSVSPKPGLLQLVSLKPKEAKVGTELDLPPATLRLLHTHRDTNNYTYMGMNSHKHIHIYTHREYKQPHTHVHEQPHTYTHIHIGI